MRHPFRHTSFFQRSLLALTLALFGGLSLGAQRFTFNFFTVDEGLGDRQITELYLGETGYLWVGTRDGLNRFDGFNFVLFGQGPYSEAGLSLGNIGGIGRDLEGDIALFYQDFNGYFDRFDPVDFTIEQVELNPANGVIGFPRTMAIDEIGRIFVITVTKDATRLYEFTQHGFVVISKLAETRDRIATPVTLLPLRNGQFLLYDQVQGMRHLSATGELISNLSLFGPGAVPLYGSGGLERLEFLQQGPEGRIYFSFYGQRGLYRFDLQQTDLTPRVVPGVPPQWYYHQVSADRLGQLLFFATEERGASSGQTDHFRLLDQAGNWVDYDELSRAGSRVYAAAGHDFRQKVFLGMHDGLGIVHRRSNKLRNFLNVEQEEEYAQRLVRGICEDQNGKIYFTEQSGQLHRLHPEDNYLDSIYLHLPAEDGDLLEIQQVNQLLYDSTTHSVWGCGQSLGGERSGILYNYDLNGCTTEAFYYSGGAFQCMARSGDNTIYLGAATGASSGELLYFDEEAKLFLPVLNGAGKPILEGASPVCLTASKVDDRLLIGTQRKGLSIVYPKRGKAVNYSPEPWKEEAVIFNDYTVYTIHENTDGSLYLGTRGGLHFFDPESEELRHYGRKDGLSSNLISGIIASPDEVGYWISTYNGITYFEEGPPATYRRYYRADGLSNDEFNPFSAFMSSRGRYYLGGINGLTSFYPSDLRKETPPVSVLIPQVMVYGPEERTITSGLDGKREVEIREDEKGVAVYFSLPVDLSSGRNRFRVRLSGLNKEWVELGDEHIVRYNNLKSGRYRLQVQATDANGNYSGPVTELPIRVYQYFYEQTWFLVLIALTIVGFLIGFLQSRSRERLNNEQLRTQLSSDIHDEVSGLLAGITMQTELLQSYTEDDHLRTRLKGVGEAGRKAMSKMSDVIWSIDSRRDTVGDLLQRMQEHADDVLLPLEIKYTFRAEGLGEKERRLAGSKRQDLYFIYKEAINNIARHSNATKVNIYLGQQGNDFEMIIRDNGKVTNGFDARKSAKTGQGLANLRMRAKRLNAVLTVDPEGDNSMHLRMKRM